VKRGFTTIIGQGLLRDCAELCPVWEAKADLAVPTLQETARGGHQDIDAMTWEGRTSGFGHCMFQLSMCRPSYALILGQLRIPSAREEIRRSYKSWLRIVYVTRTLTPMEGQWVLWRLFADHVFRVGADGA